MKNIIYLKEVSNYNDTLKKRHKIPLFIKKVIFLYKNIFNIITKKNEEGYNIWTLPITYKYSLSKINKVLKKLLKEQDNIYLLSNELNNKQVKKFITEYSIEYITEEKIKKVLLINILKYICNIQKKELTNLELTILVNNTAELNVHIIEELAKSVKTLKIVSLNIYKFKNLEEKLYNEYGIAIQFSNSYKKSLLKSKIIINLDFREIEINEYEIYNSAIIINCMANNIKVKSRLFYGVIVNSCNISLKKEIINKFKSLNIYDNYNKLMLYASVIENESNYIKLNDIIKDDKVGIINLIGNNGDINKNEFKNLDKKLDKNIKKE